MMTFSWRGKALAVDFRRAVKRVQVRDKFTDKVFRMEESKYPYTTAYIIEVDPKEDPKFWKILYSAEVGCLTGPDGDRYSYEDGRKAAMRKLNTKLPKDMRELAWDAYMNRSRESGVKYEVCTACGFSHPKPPTKPTVTENKDDSNP